MNYLQIAVMDKKGKYYRILELIII